MELSVYERLMLLQMIPAAHQQGNFLTQRTLKELMDDIGFSEEELTEWEMEQQENGRITWNDEKADVKMVELGVIKRGLIMDALVHLDEQNAVSPSLLPIFERFNYAEYLAEKAESEVGDAVA